MRHGLKRRRAARRGATGRYHAFPRRQALHSIVVSDDEARVAQPVPSPSQVVVFDFDGTLVNRDSFFDFSVQYCMARPERLLIVMATVPLAMLAAVRSRATAGSVLLWAMTVGRVVIATGTSPLLVRGLLSARRFGRLPIVGSRFRRRWGGLVIETHCTGTTKVQELERRLGIAKWSVVYTDSFADRWLLSRAEDITLVGPSSRTLLRTRRLIGESTSLRVLRPDSSQPFDPE